MLERKLREYYRYTTEYIFKKKYTLIKGLTYIPLNFHSFQSEYKSLLVNLKCTNVTKLMISTKETFHCKSQTESWYIKIPREDKLQVVAIREIIGSVFYSLFLDENIEQFYYHKEGKAIISREIKDFQPFSKYYDHLLTFNATKKEFLESLIFNNNKCLEFNQLQNFSFSISELLLGRDSSYINQLIYFLSYGVINFLEFAVRLAFQYNLNLTYLNLNEYPSSSLKYFSCQNKAISTYSKKIEEFEVAFIASYLLHNDDINHRNLGLVDKGDYNKVVVIDYDNLGSNTFTGNTTQDITKLIDWSRLSLWQQNTTSMIDATKILLDRIKKANIDNIVKKISDSLPEINEIDIINQLFSIFKFRYINSENSLTLTLKSQIENIITEVVPKQLDRIKGYYVEKQVIEENESSCWRCQYKYTLTRRQHHYRFDVSLGSFLKYIDIYSKGS